MGEIVSLKLHRKRKDRAAKEELAAENRVQFGRSKAEKALTRRSDELAQWRQRLPWVVLTAHHQQVAVVEGSRVHAHHHLPRAGRWCWAVDELEVIDPLPMIEVLPESSGSNLGSGEFVVRALCNPA